MEGYPSGRKGAVLKTVLEQSNKSSNLLPSAIENTSIPNGLLVFCHALEPVVTLWDSS